MVLIECTIFFVQYDIQWSLLSLLLHLANSPTSATHLLQTTTTTAEIHDDEEEQFDWTSYLREGDEKFVCVYDDSSSVSIIIIFL